MARPTGGALIGAAPGALFHLSPAAMSRLILLSAALVVLGGCADLGYAQGPYGARYPTTNRTSDRGRADDYSRTTQYRRISSDAADYARRLDASLGLGNGQERRIRDLLIDRTARLLQRTNPRDHRAVYPFPRRFSGDSRAARSFWSSADRDIERILDRRDADAYRTYVRGGGRYNARTTRGNTGRSNNGRANNGRANNGRANNGRGNDDGERGHVRHAQRRRPRHPNRPRRRAPPRRVARGLVPPAGAAPQRLTRRRRVRAPASPRARRARRV